MKYDIFISYRREGGYETAKHLYDLLTRDGYKVSFDIDTLRNGDFDTALLDRIDECTDFLLIVDAHAFDRTLDPDFNPQNDWLRQELAYALKKGKNIIPILLNGVHKFPDNLPDDIVGIIKKNRPEYNQNYFDAFYEKIKTEFLLTTLKTPDKNNKFKLLLSYKGCLISITFVFIGIIMMPFFSKNESESGTPPPVGISTSDMAKPIESDKDVDCKRNANPSFAGCQPKYNDAIPLQTKTIVNHVSRDASWIISTHNYHRTITGIVEYHINSIDKLICTLYLNKRYVEGIIEDNDGVPIGYFKGKIASANTGFSIEGIMYIECNEDYSYTKLPVVVEIASNPQIDKIINLEVK